MTIMSELSKIAEDIAKLIGIKKPESYHDANFIKAVKNWLWSKGFSITIKGYNDATDLGFGASAYPDTIYMDISRGEYGKKDYISGGNCAETTVIDDDYHDAEAEALLHSMSGILSKLREIK